MKRRPRLEKIAFVGDIHCGSFEGLWPEEDIGNLKSARYISTRYLNSCFKHLVDNWPDLDLLVLMGDLIDGQQRKSESTGIYTADLGEQVDGAIKVLEPLIKKSRSVTRVWGTPYHEGYHNILGKFDKTYDVKLVKQVLNIELLDGAILNVAHHPSGESAMYRGTQLDKEAIWSSVAAQEGKISSGTRWIVRAHRHFYGHQETAKKAVLCVPCFQMPTAHAIKKNYFRFQPDIGAVIMSADETHPFGYRFTPYLFDIPMPKVYCPGELL
jgi:hypothetical protein